MATREQWLIKAVRQLGVLIKRKTDADLPPVKASCGFPKGNVKTVIGQCWRPEASADGVSQVFVSPTQSDAARVLDILLHELIHAIVFKAHPEAKGHGKEFKALAVACGLEGKMTATVAGEQLAAELKLMADKLGEYPHAAIDLGLTGITKQSTRMLKLMCPCCDYTVRTTQKWIDAGMPLCPIGTEMQRA